MRIAISGLEQAACAALLPTRWEDHGLSWVPPERFLGLGGSGEAGSDAAAPTERLVWLYRAPWSIAAFPAGQTSHDAVALRLAQWFQQQRAALSIRRTLGDRVLLVNAERITAAELLSALGIAGADAADSEAEISPADHSLDLGLAKLFDWSLPQYWDLFEDLEASAWLPQGEPLFRHRLQPQSVEGMERLIQTLQQGMRFPSLRAELDQQLRTLAETQAQQREGAAALEREQRQLHDTRERLTQRIDALERSLEEAASERAALEREQTALQDEHARLAAALSSERSRVGEMEQALSTMREELARAEETAAALEASEAALKASLETQTAEAVDREQAAAKENQRLSAELDHLKDALEGQSAANRELRARLSRSTETLDRARVQLCRQLARSGAG